MCGIAGIYTADQTQPLSQPLLRAMCDAIIHRGPDEAGYFIDKGIAFGHRRLSIIDIASGQQPMVNKEAGYSLVFNGEIYNYREIRQQLIALGAHFNTASDTEVILQGWAHWGPGIIDKLTGMFAFAIWDRSDHSLYLVRDRLGIKPLFYHVDASTKHCYFGSELKVITATKSSNLSLSNHAIEDYFSFGYVPEPNTIYQQVNKLEPGHYLKVSATGIEKTCYWDISFYPTNTPTKDLEEQFLIQLQQAVGSHLEAEVPLGAFLSGGVDSSAVVAMMAHAGVNPINSCSIGFDSAAFDETHWAEKVAQQYQTRHHSKIVSADDYKLLDTLGKLYDEPYADASALPTYRVCEQARERVTVCLSGDGADELLGGYRRHRLHLMEERLRRRLPLSFRKQIFGTLGKFYPKLDWAPQILRAKTTLLSLSWDAVEAYYNSVSFLPVWLRDKLYSKDFKQTLNGYNSLQIFHHHARRYKGIDDPLSLIQYLDMKTYLAGDILTKVDRASMAHSLEVRVPFLDHRLVEWCAKLPSSSKVVQGQGKYLLKKVMQPYLPDDLLYRQKMGFSVPLANWFRGPLKERVHDELTSQQFMQLGLFDNNFIARALKMHSTKRSDHSRMIWTLLMFSIFIQQKDNNENYLPS